MSKLKTSTLTTEQYQELYKEVLLFAEIGGVTQDEEVIWKMCEEEYINELIPATEAEDRIKVIDGVCDSFVVLAQLHHYYLSKPSWEQPLYSSNHSLGYKYELDETIEGRIIEGVAGVMTCFLDLASDLADEYNFNLYKAIKEVNRSNMTKFVLMKDLVKRFGWDNNVEALAAKECEEFSKGKYKNVVANTIYHWSNDDDLHEEKIVIFRADRGNGKIIKPHWAFQEPNFDHCWL